LVIHKRRELLGGFLATNPKASGARSQLVGRGVIGGAKSALPINDIPTLEELGLI
jgi:hypothetical protein